MGSFVWPLKNHSSISSPFGYRICPFHGRELHKGIDIPAPAGTSIYAARDGTVAVSTYHRSLGNYVNINHGGGFMTQYCHMTKRLVSAGQAVTAGQEIGKVGSTGDSTGNHLHFGIKVNGEWQDPETYVHFSDKAENYTSAPPTAYAGSASGGSSAIDRPTAPERKEITTVVIRSIDGKSYVQNRQIGELEHAKEGPEIMIQSDKVYVPCLVDEITLERPRKGGPSKLTFTVLKDSLLSFFEGNPVSFTWNGEKMFFGFVFTKSRTDLTTITVTAYDQLRYLKAKDTLSYANKTYAQLVQMLADDHGLECGELEDTGYQIPARIEETTLLDMLGNASDETVLHTGKLFVLYDDYGRLQLKSLASMRLPLMLDGDTVESFDYKSSIDSDVYTKVKLASDNSTTGERETYITNDEGNQARWGILQYYQKLSGEVNAGMLQDMAKAVLTHYGTRNRTLRISGALGDIRVRGGSLLLAVLGLGDLNMRNVMLVEDVKHHFKEGIHTMDLTLSGRIGDGDEVFSA